MSRDALKGKKISRKQSSRNYPAGRISRRRELNVSTQTDKKLKKQEDEEEKMNREEVDGMSLFSNGLQQYNFFP